MLFFNNNGNFIFLSSDNESASESIASSPSPTHIASNTLSLITSSELRELWCPPRSKKILGSISRTYFAIFFTCQYCVETAVKQNKEGFFLELRWETG